MVYQLVTKPTEVRLAPTAPVYVRLVGNPARTFRLSSYYFVEHFDDADASESASFWASREPLRKVVEDMWRRHPDFAGLLPISFSVAGLNTGFGVYYLQFRPVQCSSPMPLVADDEAKRAVVQDIVMLSSGSINGGIPFLPVEGSGPESMMLALPGLSSELGGLQKGSPWRPRSHVGYNQTS